MNIVFVAPDVLGRTGWSRYAKDLGEELSKRGHAITAIVHTASNAKWCTEVAIVEPATHYLGNPLRCFFSARKVNRCLQTISPNIVHFIAEPYAFMLPFLDKGKWRTCTTIHGTYAVAPFATGGVTRWLGKEGYRQCDRIFSVSRFTKAYVKHYAPAFFDQAHLEEKIAILPNATNTTHAEFIEHTDNKEQYIISVGAVKARKGHLESIDACAAYKATTQMPFHYDIFGSLDEDPRYVHELRKRISEKGLEKIVVLRGDVDDDELAEAYKKADLFLLLSLHIGHNVEGFGLVFLEANACGVPVIGPNTGGCPEAIQNGVSGYICDPADPKGTAKRMQNILEGNAIKRTECRAWAEQHSIEQAAKGIEREYASLLSKEESLQS